VSTAGKLFWLSVAALVVVVIHIANTPTANTPTANTPSTQSNFTSPSTEATEQAVHDKAVEDAEQTAQAEADAEQAAHNKAVEDAGAVIFGHLKTCLINKAYLYNDKYTLAIDGCGTYVAMWRNFCDGDYADPNDTCDAPVYVEAQAAIYLDKKKK
jgi:hypothetical protein